jgi:hypothetical protein
MRETQQLRLLRETEAQQPERPVEYVPPSTDLVRQYAYKVCRRLSELEDQDYTGTEFTRGLTNFMRVVVRAQVRYLNRGLQYAQQKES